MTFALDYGRFCLASCVNKLTKPASEYIDHRSPTELLSSDNPLFPERYSIEQVWSKTLSPGMTADPAKDNVRLSVKKGEMVGFSVTKRDLVAVDWVTTVDYGDGERYVSSDDKTLAQGPVWFYYLRAGNTGFLEQLSIISGEGENKTRGPVGGSMYFPMWTRGVSANGTSLYSTDYDAVRVWKAPKDGTVSISGAADAHGGSTDVQILRITQRLQGSLSAAKAGMKWRSEGVSAGQVTVGGREVAQLDWTLASVENDGLRVKFHIQAYPGTSILRHWLDVVNAGSEPIKPDFFPQIFSMGLRGDDAQSFTHYWMVGGNNADDQGMLKSADVTESYHQQVGSHGQWTYTPWMAMERKNGEKDGWFAELDYMGQWSLAVDRDGDGSASFTAGLPELQFAKDVRPGERITLPMVTFGVFQRDLDDMGRRIYDWQYAYLWDYTRHDWYGRMLYANPIYGMNTGTASNQENFTFKLWQDMFHADLARRLGFDTLWDDAGWYAQAGWWNMNREGPDFAEAVRYVAKSGMGWTLWFLNHPSTGLMDTKVGSWGNFQWRTDGVASYSLKDDRELRGRIETFLDRHPRASFHTCGGGGTYAHTFEVQRYADTNYFADFGGDQTNYYFSYFETPDKWFELLLPNIQSLEGKERRMLTMVPAWADGWLNGDGRGLAPVTDLYRYLLAEGVAGRWSYVTHPVIKGDVEHQYFQRVSYDCKRSIIILKHKPTGEVTIWPRGLLPKHKYLVEFEISRQKQTRTGSDLMTNGITIKDPEVGELIYLNIPNRPRGGNDKISPTPPGRVLTRRETNLGYSGVGVYWSPGTDNNWVSAYEIRRGNRVIDKVATGAYYFDRSDGWDADAKYSVRTVDGDGNKSDWTGAGATLQDPPVYSAQGGHSSQGGRNGWRAEYSNNGRDFMEMTWIAPGGLSPIWTDLVKQPGGVEGYWEAAGTARVGHGWQQASTNAECVRTWVAPNAGAVRIIGRAVKDLYHQDKGGRLRVRILHNDVPIWPASGWANVPQSVTTNSASAPTPEVEMRDTIRVPDMAAQSNSGSMGAPSSMSGVPHDLTLDVEAGDAIRFVLDKGLTSENDYIAWMPKIVYQESISELDELSVVRILCGSGRDYTDSRGNVWSSDRFYNGSKSIRSKSDVGGATPTGADQALYKSGRIGRDFTYSIPVKSGLYALHLKFAEPKHESFFERPFNLHINGKQMLTNFDVCQAAGGARRAYEKVFHYLVPDSEGNITLRFTGGWEPLQKTDEAIVQAIEILPEVKPVVRVDVGSPCEFIDWSSSVWSSDIGFSSGECISSDSKVTQASPTLYDQDLYRTARTGKSFGYEFVLPPGLYSVHLKFAELWLKEPGKRPMNIDINGRRVRELWDPSKAAGEPGMAADFRVEDIAPDKDGKIRIAISAAGEYDAILQGIEIE